MTQAPATAHSGLAGAFHFPHRNSMPFVRIISDQATIESLMAKVSSDQKELHGYFPTDIEIAGRVEFGYTSQVLGSVAIQRLEITKLDNERIDPGIHWVALRDLLHSNYCVRLTQQRIDRRKTVIFCER